jgi:hypothetical protein
MKSFFAKLVGIPTAIWNFYYPLLKQLFSSSVEELLPIALSVVAALATTALTGSEKREEAVKQLASAAILKSIAVSESLIRFTIESAVQRLKMDGSIK